MPIGDWLGFPCCGGGILDEYDTLGNPRGGTPADGGGKLTLGGGWFICGGGRVVLKAAPGPGRISMPRGPGATMFSPPKLSIPGPAGGGLKTCPEMGAWPTAALN